MTATKGGFPVMAEITHILAANIPGQAFFVIINTVSIRCLVLKFSTNLLFAASKDHNTTTRVVHDVQNRQTIGWLQWRNIAAP